MSSVALLHILHFNCWKTIQLQTELLICPYPLIFFVAEHYVGDLTTSHKGFTFKLPLLVQPITLMLDKSNLRNKTELIWRLVFTLFHLHTRERTFRVHKKYIMRKYTSSLNRMIVAPWSEARFIRFQTIKSTKFDVR
jgi:hypothetical protein